MGVSTAPVAAAELFDMVMAAREHRLDGMSRLAGLTSRLLTTALAAALAMASSLTCLAGTLGTSHESELHACCVAMGHDCGRATTRLERDCCAAMSPARAGLIPSAQDLGRPAADAVTTPIVGDVPIPLPAPSRPERTVRGSPDTPTYLLVSVFRL